MSEQRPIFWFDVGSPNAYLAHRVLPDVEARTGARFRRVPILLGGLFKLTGGQSPVQAFAGVPAKLAYEGREIERFIARHGLTGFRMNPHFPVDTLLAMRVVSAAEAAGAADACAEIIFAAMWKDGLKLDDPQVLEKVLSEGGLPAAEWLAASQTPEIKARLVENTEEAARHGAFGAPSFLVAGELYFGKDRLRDVEDALLAPGLSS